jgi:hypothetical protein
VILAGAIIPALMHRIPSELAVKRAWARVVLGWVTSREVLVLHPSPFLHGSAMDRVLSSPPPWLGDVRWRGGGGVILAGAIIPALMHRIPSELPVKRAWARVVLGWVTSREVLVLHPPPFFCTAFARLPRWIECLHRFGRGT